MDKKTVETISYLSRLKIDVEKEDKITEDLKNIIKFVDQLNDVNTSKINPLTNPLEKTAKTREDHVLSLINISEPTRPNNISYSVFCL